MSHNPRISTAPGGSSQQSRSRKKEDDNDAFMRLPDKEIVGCITDIGISFSVADLQKPNPVQVQQIFEWFAELLLNATRETVEPAMRAATEDVCGEYSDCMPPDTRNLMGFYVSLRRLLLECGIVDFGFNDLYRPTHDRLVKIFSYIINFVRFRESQTGVIDEHFNRAENTKARIELLYGENRDAEARIGEMRRRQRAVKAEVQEKTARNEELKRQLLELQRAQERVALRLEDAKARKNDLTALLQDKAAQRHALKQESAKLRPYTLQSPQALQAALAGLTNTLSADRARTDGLDRRARALQTSADSFAAVAADVAACIRVLEEIAAELSKEDDENAKKTRQQDSLSQHGDNVRQVERREVLLRKQLQKWNERTERLRDASRQKASEAKAKMVELRDTHRRLTEEHTDRGREMERSRVRIEQTEKKMLDLKETIENEVHSAHDEYLKLESHVKLYITEIEQWLPHS